MKAFPLVTKRKLKVLQPLTCGVMVTHTTCFGTQKYQTWEFTHAAATIMDLLWLLG